MDQFYLNIHPDNQIKPLAWLDTYLTHHEALMSLYKNHYMTHAEAEKVQERILRLLANEAAQWAGGSFAPGDDALEDKINEKVAGLSAVLKGMKYTPAPGKIESMGKEHL